MIIVADSGSSKTDWRFLYPSGRMEQARTGGFNPYYQPVADFEKMLVDEIAPLVQVPVQKIAYYGTGVSSEKNQAVIVAAFHRVLGKAPVEVGWDLLGAARALCGRQPGIACILGTGSNSCHYDGSAIVANTANLGWILADEGSGTYLGKQLVVDYYRQRMPPEVADKFRAYFPFSREEMLARVYQGEKPGTFLAGLARFLHQHLHTPYGHGVAYAGLAAFLENNVMAYPEWARLPVHFTGSIAFHFSSVLRQAAQERGLTVRHIVEAPIAGLALYHQVEFQS